MTIDCNVSGSERKCLAQALGAILLWEPVYQGAPSFGYAVGNYTVDRNGTISCPDSATPEIVERIISKLTDEGFTPEVSGEEASAEIPAESPDVALESEADAMPEMEELEANVGAETPVVAAETAEANPPAEDIPNPDAEDDPKDSDSNDDTHLSVSIPRDKLPDEALARLRIMVSNKEALFKRALLADALPIEVSEDKVSFPWFTLTGMDGEAEAYTQFIDHLCKMAVEQTRVLDKPYDGDNDRFAMRIFMVRLGMKGTQFALARKLMMNHLTGNSGWRYGAPPKKAEIAPVIPAVEPEETLVVDLPDMETAEDSEFPLPEETPNTTAEDAPDDNGLVPDKVIPDPVEAEPTSEDAAPAETSDPQEDDP